MEVVEIAVTGVAAEAKIERDKSCCSHSSGVVDVVLTLHKRTQYLT